MLGIGPPLLLRRMQASAQANADVAKAAAILVWILIWQLAAMGLGHGGLFLATPLQTLGGAGTAGTHSWHSGSASCSVRCA